VRIDTIETLHADGGGRSFDDLKITADTGLVERTRCGVDPAGSPCETADRLAFGMVRRPYSKTNSSLQI
jgi:hypothetical protein